MEVCIATGGRFSDHQTTWQDERPPVRGMLLVRDKEDLVERINHRAEGSLAEEGLDEVRSALRSPMSETASRIIGLKEVDAFVRGKVSRVECLEQIRLATCRYAKRQMTWFRGETFAEVVNLTPCKDIHACARIVAGRVNEALSENGSTRDKPSKP